MSIGLYVSIETSHLLGVIGHLSTYTKHVTWSEGLGASLL